MDSFVPGFSTEIDPSADPQGFVVERCGSWLNLPDFKWFVADCVVILGNPVFQGERHVYFSMHFFGCSRTSFMYAIQ